MIREMLGLEDSNDSSNLADENAFKCQYCGYDRIEMRTLGEDYEHVDSFSTIGCGNCDALLKVEQ